MPMTHQELLNKWSYAMYVFNSVPTYMEDRELTEAQALTDLQTSHSLFEITKVKYDEYKVDRDL